MSAPSDDSLMVAVQDDDLEQLGVLFDRYHRPLYAFFVGMTSSRPLSEDLVQEVFVRILRFRHTYRAGSQFRTWMYEIARHVAYDQGRTGARETLLDDAIDVPMTSPEPGVRLAYEQEARLLRSALASLPTDKREILVLSRFQGLRYDEVGQILGCETGAVKVRVHRAVKALRERFFRIRHEALTCRAMK